MCESSAMRIFSVNAANRAARANAATSAPCAWKRAGGPAGAVAGAALTILDTAHIPMSSRRMPTPALEFLARRPPDIRKTNLRIMTCPTGFTEALLV